VRNGSFQKPVFRALVCTAATLTVAGASLSASNQAHAEKRADKEDKYSPTMTNVREVLYNGRVVVLKTPAITHLLTILRDVSTKPKDFAFASDRVMRLLMEEGLALLPGVKAKTVNTPCGTYTGIEIPAYDTLCGVSIIRSGDIPLDVLRKIAPGMAVGKILIQRDESTVEKLPTFYYSKLPPDVATRRIILVDPMLGTGGSAKTAIKCLIAAGCVQENIIFLNLLGCDEGIQAIFKEYPKIRIVTCGIEPYMNHHKYLVPGIGDFGDRYYST
jgi:uracil phosphoribosyltransferase